VGKEVLGIAERMLTDAQSIRDVADSQRGAHAGVVRMGLPPTVGPYLLPRILPRLHRAYPDLQIHVREEKPAALPERLLAGRHDLALLPLPVQTADLEVHPLFREPLFVVVPDDHKLAMQGFVTKEDLRDEPVLALEPGHQLHEQVEALCEDFGARLLFDYAGTSLETVSQMIALGMGISFLSGLFVETSLSGRSGITVLTLKDRALYRTLGLAWRRTSVRRREYEILAGEMGKTIETDFPGFARV
ncbi:MAG: LysR substrate-binding domain-containing protein, partial [Pseudomonadota bacterium]